MPNSAPYSNMWCVEYGNGLFVAGGNGAVWSGSGNEDIWYSLILPNDITLRGCAYGNNIFVIVGYNGKIYLTSDGKNYNEIQSGINNSLLCATYGNGMFLAAGDGGIILKSADGTHWEQILSDNAIGNIIGITYGKNSAGNRSGDRDNFFICTSIGKVYASSDLTTWKEIYSGTITLNAIKYNLGTMISVGNSTILNGSWKTKINCTLN